MTDRVPEAPQTVVVQRGASPAAWFVAIALAAVLGALLFVGGYLAAGGTGSASCAAPSEQFEALCQAYDRLKREYVDDLDDDALAEGAIRGMFQYGVPDDHSGYMSPDEYQSALGDLSGKFSGIGAEMAVKNLEDEGNTDACPELSDVCALVVVAPLAGSPAEAAGVQSGDIVLAVDGESVNGTTITDQIGRIRGEEGTDVTLTMRRDDETFDVTITRAEITLQEVATRLIDGHVGYIALNGFSDAASEQFRSGLAALIADGANQIVLDLRDNPGGYIEAAQQIASQFIAEGLIFTQESAGDDVREWRATDDGVATNPEIEVVVLVNRGTASASEIVAAALQESGRAAVVGEPTFGKNTVQVWSRLDNGGGVRITVSRWFTPGHNSVAPDGLQPDLAVARTLETPPEQDVALDAALELLADGAVGSPAGSAPPPASDAVALGADGGAVVGIVQPRKVC